MNIEDKYAQLVAEHNELLLKHAELVTEYSENTIIQSMMDMKIKYEELASNSVPHYKYNKLQEKYNKLEKDSQGGIVLMDHIIKLLMQCQNGGILHAERMKTIQKAHFGLVLLKEILGKEN
jgi:tRNA(Ile)-lysidine synthase TilS/MesJ